MTAWAAPPDSSGHSATAGRFATVVRPDEYSGHLVRSVVVQPREVNSVEVAAREIGAATAPRTGPTPDSSADIVAMVERIAAAEGVELSLVHSVIRAESGYNPRAVSPKGALGVMQLIPSTARRFGVADAFDPEQNIQGGVKYLRFLLNYYSGDYPKAIAAYNAGEAAVDRFHGIPPYPETRDYVLRVARNLKIARQVLAARPAPAAAPAPSSGEKFAQIVAQTGPDGRVYYKTTQ